MFRERSPFSVNWLTIPVLINVQIDENGEFPWKLAKTFNKNKVQSTINVRLVSFECKSYFLFTKKITKVVCTKLTAANSNKNNNNNN